MKTFTLFVALLVVAGVAWSQSQGTAKDPVKAYNEAKKAYQDASLELQRSDFRNQKREIISSMFKLTEAQEKAFWPVYDSYEKELMKLNDQRISIIKDYAAQYAKLTDAQAMDLASRALDFAQKRLALRKTYMENLAKVIPGIQVARLLQFENQTDLLIDLQIASEVPLAE